MLSDRIVVTGATGFIGRHLVERLARDGRSLTLPVRDLNRCPREWRQNHRINLVEAPDLTWSDTLIPMLEQASTVVHLAGLAHAPRANTAAAEAQFMMANTEVTRALVEASSRSGITAFVNLSSVHAVDANATERIIDDHASPIPSSAYGRSKRAAEEQVSSLSVRNVFAISLRPPLVFEADARGNWAMLQRLAASRIWLPFASIANQRSFIGVGTLCEAISALVSREWKPELSGNYCIADEEWLSLPDVVRELRWGMGLSPRLFACPSGVFDILGLVTGRRRQLAGLTGNLRIDPSRFFSTFSIKASTPVREAIRESGAGYVANRLRS